jgi:hypothetical protein
VPLDECLVPGDAAARLRRHGDDAVAHGERLAQHRGRVGEVLEPVGARRRRQQVRAHLGVDVRRDRPPRRMGQRGGAGPSRDAADAAGVEHHVVARARREVPRRLAGAPPALAGLDRGARGTGDGGGPGRVVGVHGLLDPREPLGVEALEPRERLGDREAVPRRGVDRVERRPEQPRRSQQPEARAQRLVDLERRERPARELGLERRDGIAHRPQHRARVAEGVRRPGHALPRVEVEQDERGARDLSARGLDRPLHGRVDGAHGEARR